MTSPLAWWRSFDAQSRTLMAAAALNFTCVLLLPPPLFVWLLVVDLCATCAALGWWCLVLEDRLDTTTSEALTAAYEARIATELLAQREADARVVAPITPRCSCGHPVGGSGIHSDDCDIWPGPTKNVIPMQRTGHEPWPPVARAVEAETTPIHDDTAVDLFMRSVERWGEDAER